MGLPSASVALPDDSGSIPLANFVRRLQPLTAGFRVYFWLIALSLLVAALSLTYPATPSYDPWSWLLWGREIVHGTLSLKDSGSSWKPLPMVFTTPFALAGNAAPNLWLLISRAGFVLAVLMSARIAFRVTLTLTFDAVAAGTTHPAWPRSWLGRTLQLGPAALAACLAAVGVALTHSFPGNALMGYSEAVALAFILIAAERLAAGHHRQAFALLLPAALDRPEVWAFWGPYGLWLMWRDRGAVKLVVGLAVLAVAMWFVPTHLGGHSAVKQALTNHSSISAVNSSSPFWTELRDVEWHLLLTRAKAALLLAGLVSLWILGRNVRRRTSSGIGVPERWLPADSHERAMLGLLGLAAFGAGWFLVVAIETQMGFAGNPRYAVFGSAQLYIASAIGFGWGAAAMVRRGQSLRWCGEHRRPQLLAVATAVLALVALFVPDWVGSDLMSISSLHRELRFQARIRSQIAALVEHQGGAKAILRCGPVMSGNYEVPIVAWYLGTPTSSIAGSGPSAVAPATIFQVSPTSTTEPDPDNDLIGGWIEGGANYQITMTDPVTLYSECHR